MRRGDMHVKTVCTNCGEICRTGSIKNFRHCGIEQNVEANLLAGEAEKFKKLVAKKTGKPVDVKPVEVEKPVEKIVEKVAEKKNDTPVVAPIIEEKSEVVPEKKVVKKRKKKAEIVEKVVKKEGLVEKVFSFGFFE